MSFFLAVEIDDVLRAEVMRVTEEAQRTIRASWVKAEKWHLTLVFLGEPDAARLAELPAVIEPLARACPVTSLQIKGCGTFETARAPVVLWLGVAGALEPLRTLQGELSRALHVDEGRDWVPHLTLARAKHAEAFVHLQPHLNTFESTVFRPGALVLFESRHDRYVATHRWSFADPQHGG